MKTSVSSKSRSELSVGTVFFYHDYHGHNGPKSRYFVAVADDEQSFFSFTPSSGSALTLLRKFPESVTPLIPGKTTCLPKDCVVDCRTLYSFDDIMMSSYLASRRVEVKGKLPVEIMRSIRLATSTSKVLEERKKLLVLDSLDRHMAE